MDRKVTNGLAWVGLLLVFGVPTADFLAQKFGPERAMATASVAAAVPAVKPVAAVKEAKAEVPKPVAPIPATRSKVASEEPVEAFIKKGKALPSYISGEDAPAPAKTAAVEPKPQVPVKKPAPTAKPEVVASAPKPTPAVEPEAPVKTADTPRVIPGATPVSGASAEPQVVVAQPKPQQGVTTWANPQVASLEPQQTLKAPIPMPATMRPTSAPVEDFRTGSVAAPVEDEIPEDDYYVSSEELADWESGPLEEFLAKRRQAEGFQEQPRRPSGFDDDGFFLSDGPNDDEVILFPFAVN